MGREHRRREPWEMIAVNVSVLRFSHQSAVDLSSEIRRECEHEMKIVGAMVHGGTRGDREEEEEERRRLLRHANPESGESNFRHPTVHGICSTRLPFLQSTFLSPLRLLGIMLDARYSF